MDDLANLCVFLMNNYSGNETVNAGTGKELTIRELTEIVAGTVGYEGKYSGTQRSRTEPAQTSGCVESYGIGMERPHRTTRRGPHGIRGFPDQHNARRALTKTWRAVVFTDGILQWHGARFSRSC